ncbi:MAG: toluene monooxygenase [Chloroflexi bacterium]|nr:MAG: toluene monooxygenase [Chloroflexota bacterium]
MATIPLQATFEGNFVIFLALVEDQATTQVIAEQLAQHVIGRLLTPQNGVMRLRYNNSVLPVDKTLAEIGIGPMEFVEAFYDA